MEEYIINPYIKRNFKLILNSFYILDNKFDFKIEPDDKEYLTEWNNLFNINSLLKKEFEDKIEEYELTYKFHTLEALKELVESLRYQIEITKLAYLDYKIRNYDRIKKIQDQF